MRLRTSWFLAAAPAVLALAAAGWLWRENRALERELELERSARRPASAATAGSSESDGDGGRARDGDDRGGVRGFLRGLGRARARPELPDAPEESRGERRRRRQEEVRAMLGRETGESVEEYRARVAPMVQTALAVPRGRLKDARAEAERAAGVTDAQRAEMDALFADVTRETLALTNEAIASGELTPYERNYAGVLSWAGGLGAILGSTQTRLGEIISPAQRQSLADAGFDYGEYLGVTMPWEQLDPPPPEN